MPLDIFQKNKITKNLGPLKRDCFTSPKPSDIVPFRVDTCLFNDHWYFVAASTTKQDVVRVRPRENCTTATTGMFNHVRAFWKRKGKWKLGTEELARAARQRAESQRQPTRGGGGRAAGERRRPAAFFGMMGGGPKCHLLVTHF